MVNLDIFQVFDIFSLKKSKMLKMIPISKNMKVLERAENFPKRLF